MPDRMRPLHYRPRRPDLPEGWWKQDTESTPKLKTLAVSQNGGIFYLHEGKQSRTVKSPDMVREGNLEDAKRARRWFLGWCGRNAVTPLFTPIPGVGNYFDAEGQER